MTGVGPHDAEAVGMRCDGDDDGDGQSASTSGDRTPRDIREDDRQGDGEKSAGRCTDAAGHASDGDTPVPPAALKSVLRDALRADALDPAAEQHALAAFRAARDAEPDQEERVGGGNDPQTADSSPPLG
ncbi:hypothetical protein [Streptomyces nodosus]|uniref:hypothetical protein n=1 Tax=Streptomyces nodosus TaxID=40318 RepID=UPI00380338BA